MWQYAIKRLLAFIPVYITVLAAITYLAWEHMDVVDAWLTKNATQETRINKMREFDLIGNELMMVVVKKKGSSKAQTFSFYKRPDKAITIGSGKDTDITLTGSGIAASHLKLVYRPNGKTLRVKLPPLRRRKRKAHGHGHGHSAPPRRRPKKRKPDARKPDARDSKAPKKADAGKKDAKKAGTNKAANKGDVKKVDAKKVDKRDAVPAPRPAPVARKAPPSRRKAVKPKARYVTRYLTRKPYKGTVTLSVLAKKASTSFNGKAASGSMKFGKKDTVKIGEYTITLKLDRSVMGAIFARNMRKIWKTLKWDFGNSIDQRKPVSRILWERAPISLSLTLPALLITAMLGVIIGLLAAFFRGTVVDRTMILAAVVGMSISSLVYIIVLQYFLAFQFKLFNIYGFSDGWMYRISDLILPTLIQVAVSLGYNARFYRTVMVEESGKDYITTAYAKGVSKVKIIFVHMLRNAMIPIITRVFVSLPFLFLGSFLLEIFFGIPGLGSLMILSLTGKTDPPIIIGATTVLCVLYIFCLIATDIAYAIADPRVRLN